MKLIALTLIAVSLAAGAVSAADFGNGHEKPDAPARSAAAAQTVTVDAGAVYSAKELRSAGLKSFDKVTVTDLSAPKASRTFER
ncbi:hypothetical protein JJJ17_12790 [Paracoccus caeni]|uniref:Uncharacterized protein n=1 Tax=Paracoccus caeni TaxID=657651 RepID=A0A934SF98_9RHOB|nr:hypothetical protein [Paracoccus caeni]MBK4216807.1 hypothetical protein [Paracoccus caeni]